MKKLLWVLIVLAVSACDDVPGQYRHRDNDGHHQNKSSAILAF